MLPMMRGWLAEVYAQSGEDETALSILEETLNEIGDVTGRAWESELWRQKGEIVMSHDPARLREAELCFKSALETARRQNARSLELRAATSLARVWQLQGRLDEARDLTAPICSWFTEGADTRDLQHARNVQMTGQHF
jgi:predicted ATPase